MRKKVIIIILCLLIGAGAYFLYKEYNRLPEEYLEFNQDGVKFDRSLVSSELENKYYYNQLNDKEKLVYESMYVASKEYSNSFDYTFEILNDEVLSKARDAFNYDMPLYYWWNDYLYTDTLYMENRLGNKFYYYQTKSSTHDAIDFDVIIDLIEDKCNEILEQCKDDDEYTNIKNIHDYLVENVVYCDYAPNEHAITGPLLNGKSVCDGYAYSFELLTNMAGFDCITVIGTAYNSADDEKHAWNMIKINDNWYHVDVTWDDVVYEDDTEYTSHQYFLSNDAYMNIDHKVLKNFVLPECKDLSLYYRNMPGNGFNSFNKTEITQFISKWLTKGYKKYDLIFLNNEDYEKAYKWLYVDEGLVDIYRTYYDAYSAFSYGVNYNDEENYLQVYYLK